MCGISAKNPPLSLKKPNFKQARRQFLSHNIAFKDTYQKAHSFGQKTFQ